MKTLTIDWKGSRIRAEGELVDGVWWIYAAGEVVRLDPRQQGSRRKGRGASAGDGPLLAPMPGKITKVFKLTGDRISRGEAVLVMEAMKMEYTLKAEADGVVSELSCDVGDQVSLGQVLAVIEPAETSG